MRLALSGLLLLSALAGGCNLGPNTDLLDAAAAGRRDLVVEAVLQGGSVNVRRLEDAATPLMLAAEGGHLDVIEFLLARGAAIDYRRNDGSTALMLAVLARRSSAVETLLAAGADPNLTASQFGMREVTPLHCWVITDGADETGRALIQSGADVTARTGRDYTPWQLAVTGGRHRVLLTMLDAMQDGHRSREIAERALVQASRNGQANLADALLGWGARPDARDGDASPALCLAAAQGHVSVVESLVKHRADLGLADARGRTALHWSVLTGREDIAQALLNAKAPLQPRDADGRTPLAEAIRRGDEAFADLLRRHGARE